MSLELTADIAARAVWADSGGLALGDSKVAAALHRGRFYRVDCRHDDDDGCDISLGTCEVWPPSLAPTLCYQRRSV